MVITKHAKTRLRECGFRVSHLRPLEGLRLGDGKHRFPVEGTGEVTFVVKANTLVTVLRPGMS